MKKLKRKVLDETVTINNIKIEKGTEIFVEYGYKKGRNKEEIITTNFIDNRKKLWTVEVERTYRNGYMEFTMSGKGDGSLGQNLDRVVPANKAQKDLINYWKKYHLTEIDEKIWRSVIKTVEAVEKEEEKRRESEMVTWDDINDDKIIALGQYLELTPEEAQDTIEESYGNTYDAGGTEYLVCTDDEADDEARESIENLIDDMGVTVINGWEQFIDEDSAERFFRDIYDSWNRGYAEDIANENGRYYENRLIDEMVDAGIIDDETAEDEEYDYEDDINEFIDWMTDQQIEEGGGGYDHYSLNFGEDEANKILLENDLVDIDEVVDYVIRTDGRGHTLNGYDGTEGEMKVNGTYYYIYER